MDATQDIAKYREHLGYMRLAVSLERKCKPEDTRKHHPKVGVVVVSGSEVTTAFRGEREPGEHGEYTALVKKLEERQMSGATLYTTLEPCTTRRHPKRPCYEWILRAGISRVFIGILDPNPDICGVGEWILKANNVLVDRFPSELQVEIERDNQEFVAEQRPKLLKRIETLRHYVSLTVPCAYCNTDQPLNVPTCEWGTNQAVDCPACGRRYFLHLIGQRGDFFTTQDGRHGYGVPPTEGLSLPIGVRRQLKKSQLWIEPRQFPGLLKLMRDTERSLISRGSALTPYDLMQAMVQSDQLLRYGVKTKSIRQFFNYLLARGYFLFEMRDYGAKRYWRYRNIYEEDRAVKYYLIACLSILHRNQVVTTLDTAVAAAQYLLSDLGRDVVELAREQWGEVTSNIVIEVVPENWTGC